MKVTFLEYEMSDWTGGCLYDGLLYNKLIERFGKDNVKLLLYADYYKEFRFVRKDYFKLALAFRRHSKEILDCDYAILNVSSYKIFSTFPWRRKKKTDAKFIGITHHPDYLLYKGSRKYILHKMAYLFTLRHMDQLLTPNIYTKDSMKPLGLYDKTALIEAYLDNTVKEVEGPRENIICFVGTVEGRKGVEYGIKAFARFLKDHPDYEFHIAGSFHEGYCDWNYCTDMEKLVQDLGVADKVKFLGRVSNEEKNSLYAKSKAFLFPSLLEGYGWVMVEAMSYGLPVIAFDNTAMPYTVNETNGVLVPNKDVEAMADALAKVIDDPDLRERLSEGAKETVRNLPTREAIDREYQELMDKMEKKLF